MTNISSEPSATGVSTTSQHGPLGRALVEIISSSCGSALGLAISHPFDTIKTRAQFALITKVEGTAAALSKPPTNGMADVFREIVGTEGVTGLWRGLATPLLATSGFSAVLFFTYMHAKTGIAHRFPSLSLDTVPHSYNSVPRLTSLGCVVAGACTGFASSFLQGPVDLAKTKVQAQSMRRFAATASSSAAAQNIPAEPIYNGSVHCLVQIYKQYGLRGIMQGQAATTARNVPATAVYFGSYEYLKHQLSPSTATHQTKPPLSVSLFAGGVAGIAYWVTTYPIDVVKSRMQGDASDPRYRQYRNMVHCVRKSYANEGLTAFYRGFVPCMYRAIICNAFTFAGYETIKSFVLSNTSR